MRSPLCLYVAPSPNFFCFLCGPHRIKRNQAISSSQNFLETDEIAVTAGEALRDLFLPLTRVEAGSNTSTVTLRVVRGDEMGLKKAAP
jgi:hypothetical protein